MFRHIYFPQPRLVWKNLNKNALATHSQVTQLDGLPAQLCSACVQAVTASFEFKQQSERAFETLKTLLGIDTYTPASNATASTTSPPLFPPPIVADDIIIREYKDDDKPIIDFQSNLDDLKPSMVATEKSIQTDEIMIFPCEMCSLKYFNDDDLRSHRLQHIDFQCRCCSKTYSRLCHLRQHIVDKHPTEVLARDHESSEHMATQTALERTTECVAAEQSNEFFRCLRCGKTFELEMDFLRHDEECDCNVDGPSVVPQSKEPSSIDADNDADDYNNLIKRENCSEDCFADEDDDHRTESFNQNMDNDVDDVGSNLVEQPPTPPTPPPPPPPPRKRGRPRKNLILAQSVESTRTIVEKDETNQCTKCDKQFTRSCHLKRHMMSHLDVKPYECEICTKKFSRIDHLNVHRLHHSDVKPYACDICQRGFTRAEHLRKHKLSRHNGGGPEAAAVRNTAKTVFCEICQKGFTTAKYLLVHMRSHTDRVFACKFCESKHESKADLNEHMKVHINERPFLCSECGLRFVRNDYLVIHMRRHKGEKPYKCKYCGKGFPRATDLSVHERYHTGEKTHLCTICGKGFHRAYNLLVHMRVHTGERPYQCPHCVKSFAQGNDLKAHVRRHTGERYKCEVCGDGFIQGYHLTQHKRNVHGIDMKSHIRRVEKVGEMVEEYIDDVGDTTLPAIDRESDQMGQQHHHQQQEVVVQPMITLVESIKLEPYMLTVCNDSSPAVS